MINPTATGGLVDVGVQRLGRARQLADAAARLHAHRSRAVSARRQGARQGPRARHQARRAAGAAGRRARRSRSRSTGPQGKTFVTTEATLSAFGGFWFDVDLPGDARLGDYTITATLEHGTFTRSFTVEDYRPATFEVTRHDEGERCSSVAATCTARSRRTTSTARRCATAASTSTVHSRKRRVALRPAPGLRVRRRAQLRVVLHVRVRRLAERWSPRITSRSTRRATATSRSSVGRDEVTSDADLLVRADVHSPSNEVISKSFTIPYFRSKRYFGIKSPGYFLDVGKPQKFQIVAVGARRQGRRRRREGEGHAPRLELRVGRLGLPRLVPVQGHDADDPRQDRSRSPAASRRRSRFTPTSGGDYLVVVEGENDKAEARRRRSACTRGATAAARGRATTRSRSTSPPTSRSTRPATPRTLILKTDLANATGLVTIERDGVIEQRLIDDHADDEAPDRADHRELRAERVRLGRARAGPHRRWPARQAAHADGHREPDRAARGQSADRQRRERQAGVPAGRAGHRDREGHRRGRASRSRPRCRSPPPTKACCR